MRQFLLCTLVTFLSFNAAAQTPDCKSITDPAARLKCYDQPKDCKSITDSAARLQCYDAKGPAATAAPTTAPAAAPAQPDETPLLRIVKTEPPIGHLPTGTAVLVDDGSCPAGKIKKVVGGDVTIGQARIRSCVPRPPK
jgi:Family of unknown function (DUF6719)